MITYSQKKNLDQLFRRVQRKDPRSVSRLVIRENTGVQAKPCTSTMSLETTDDLIDSVSSCKSSSLGGGSLCQKTGNFQIPKTGHRQTAILSAKSRLPRPQFLFVPDIIWRKIRLTESQSVADFDLTETGGSVGGGQGSALATADLGSSTPFCLL